MRALLAVVFAASLAGTAAAADKASGPSSSQGGVRTITLKIDSIQGDPIPSAGGVIRVGQDAVVAAGQTVDGPILVVGGSAIVDGTVDGPIAALGGSVRLGPSARVKGPVLALGGRLEQAAGSSVEGPVLQTPGPGVLAKAAAWLVPVATVAASFYLAAKLFAGLGWIVLAAALWLLFPGPLKRTRESLEKDPAAALVWGCLGWPGLALIALALLVSLLGIPLLPPLAVLSIAAYLWGFGALSWWLGDKLAGGRWDSPVMSIAVGVVLLTVLGLVPLARWLVFMATAALALGATLRSRFGTR